MMMLPQLLALSLALAPNVVSAALFPENSLVKMIDHKGFKAAMKENMTSVVAFVAPWCGHCQRMVPEYSKAALGLHPLVPLYAVDCDAAANKRLCADQGVKGFPTVKLFPRGKNQPPIDFTGTQRSASEFFYFAKRGIPNKIKKIHQFEDMDIINDKKIRSKPRAVLMNKSNKMPLLWSTLANKYQDDVEFFTHRDRKGKNSVKMGFEAGEGPKVLIYPTDDTKPVQFMGIMKFDSMSNFFDSLIDGSVDLAELNAAAAAEEFTPDPAELEIEQQQEAEMLALAHGGFSNLIDFEAAVKDGSAKDFHSKNGYPGMMGGVPGAVGADKDEEKKETKSSSKSKKINMPVTGDAGQIVMEAQTDVGGATATATEGEATETPETASEPEAEPAAEAEPDNDDADFEDETENVPAPEPPVEPSVGEESERVKDEL